MRSVRVAFLLLTAMLAPGTAAAGSGCGPDTRLPARAATADWVETNTPLYVFDRRGRLFRAGFDQRPWVQLTDHEFQPGVASLTVVFSADRRWILYSGTGRSGGHELWLYDTRTGRDRLVLEGPGQGGNAPVFSLDGRRAAWFAREGEAEAGLLDRLGSLWRESRSGFYVLDTASGHARFLGVPAPSRFDPDESVGLARWSFDGKALLLALGGADGYDHYIVAPDTGKFIPIEGAEIDGETKFLRDGKPVPLAERNQVNVDARFRSWPSGVDGGWGAVFDEHKVLRVVDGRGRSRTVAKGDQHNRCGSGIHGWVDGDKYLLYLIDENSYIYDPESGRKAPLFRREQAEVVQNFYW